MEKNQVLLGIDVSAYHSLPIAYNTWNNWVLKNRIFVQYHEPLINVKNY